MSPSTCTDKQASHTMFDYSEIMMTDIVAINMIIEVNAAKSRIKSIIYASISVYVCFLFDFCSIVNRRFNFYLQPGSK